MVRALLGRPETEVNRAKANGVTPLWMAAQNGHAAVVQALLCHVDVDVNALNERGVTPLMVASQVLFSPSPRISAFWPHFRQKTAKCQK